MVRFMVFSFLTLCCVRNVFSESIVRVDLASETAWSLRVDGGADRPIKVPYGGWNSDMQPQPQIKEYRDVNDFVIYKRQIKIPMQADGNIVVLYCGAINYGAEIFIDGLLVAKHDSPFTSFEVDLTPYVKGGQSYVLDVKAYHINHYNTKNKEMLTQGKRREALEKGNIIVPTGYIYYDGVTKLPFGICRAIELRVYPAVYIKDVFVRPSVTTGSLTYDIWIENRSAEDKQVKLASSLNSWNGDKWQYPVIPDTTLEIPRGQVKKFTIGAIEWKLGQESYWWPNIPFRENYKAKLHNLQLTLSEGSKQLDYYVRRFGFVEHAEGEYYYTINGVRVNLPADSTAITQGCFYDGYTEAAAFQPPTGPGTGCHESWSRFMRIGIRAYRTHQEPPTDYIMQAADEVGFIIIPETAIRGSYLPQAKDAPSYETHIREMIRVCRNHPSVARYSLSNELDAQPQFIDYAVAEDNSRPLVYESNTHNDVSFKIESSKGQGHAYTMAHYCSWPHPARQIFGMGEYAWATDGMADYATRGKKMRLDDVCYFSGWSWLNYWPNFLQGFSHDTYAWQQNNHSDRKDGVDGWGSDIIKYVQKSLHPYLIMDHQIEEINGDCVNWPAGVPTLKPGTAAVRKIEVFNDALLGDNLTFKWFARWDSAPGQEFAKGTQELNIQPGFHKTVNVEFKVPEIHDLDERRLYLVMESVKEGKVVFREDRIYYRISNKEPDSRVELITVDTDTKGMWKGKYGKDGCSIIGAEQSLPGYATLTYRGGWDYVINKDSKNEYALQYFSNDGNIGYKKIESKYANYQTISVTVDVGSSWRQVALYFVDWDYMTPHQTVIVPECGFKFLMEELVKGKYFVCKVRGKVTFVLEGPRNSSVNGVFFDTIDAK